MCTPLRLLMGPAWYGLIYGPLGGIGEARVESPHPGAGPSCLTAAWPLLSGWTYRRHIPHSTGLGSSKLHLRWSSRECRCQMQSQIRAFSQRCPVQTCTHSCCPALRQTLLPGQSSGCGVGQMSGWNNKCNFSSDDFKTPSGPKSLKQQAGSSSVPVGVLGSARPVWESRRNSHPTLLIALRSESTFCKYKKFNLGVRPNLNDS